jgi:hypothetical protein
MCKIFILDMKILFKEFKLYNFLIYLEKIITHLYPKTHQIIPSGIAFYNPGGFEPFQKSPCTCVSPELGHVC